MLAPRKNPQVEVIATLVSNISNGEFYLDNLSICKHTMIPFKWQMDLKEYMWILVSKLQILNESSRVNKITSNDY